MKKYLLLPSLIFFSLPLFAQTEVTTPQLKDYAQLKLLDIDEMNKLLQTELKVAKKSTNPEQHILNSLTLLMSRPDEDNLRSKLISTVKPTVDSTLGWEDALATLAQTAIEKLQKQPAEAVNLQITNSVILENILSELKPSIKDNEDVKKIVSKIAEADIKISEEARNERQVRVMKMNKSPSEIAQDLMMEVAPKKK